jgi:hypothetical protein
LLEGDHMAKKPRPSEWAIVVIFADGDRAYVSGGTERRFTGYRGSAARYESREAALYIAYTVKGGRVAEVDVEEIVNPRRTGT